MIISKNDHLSSLANIWSDLLSRKPLIIANAFCYIAFEDKKEVISHLEKMIS